MRIVVATQFIGAFKALRPVADALKAQGHEVLILAEGQSIQHWKDAGWPLTFAGSINWQKEPFEFDAEMLLRELKPDIVVVGCGHPINIEQKCADAANQLGIPLVILEDFWGVSHRLEAKPQVIFTLDAAGANLIQQEARFAGAKVYQVGNPGLAALQIPEGLKEQVSSLQKEYGRLIVFGGEGKGTRDLLETLLGSLVQTIVPFAVIPRFHPKHVERSPEWVAVWERQLAMFEKLRPGHILRLNDVKSSDALAALCDVTVSGSGTMLLHAAYYRRPAVSISTPLTQQCLLEQVTYNRFPGIECGIALELTAPVDDFFAFLDPQTKELHRRQVEYFATPPLSPDDIAQRLIAV